MRIKVLDLFAGVGGLSYGFSQDEAFEIVAANEIEKDISEAYRLNHPSVKVYCKDIKDFGIKDLKSDFNINNSDIELVIGGAPCQSYSTIGKRRLDDPKSMLFKEYCRVLEEVNPKVFIFENVKGLISMDKGKLFANVLSDFEKLGYKVTFNILNSAEYGVPQLRERVIVVGSKLNRGFEFPEITHADNDGNEQLFENDYLPFVTLAEAIGDLPFIGNNSSSKEYRTPPQNEYQRKMRINAPKELKDHASAKNNEQLLKLMQLLPDGGTPEDIPIEYRPKSGFKNTYCKLWWNKPSTTITRNLGTPSSSRCIHPKAHRALTTREGARIQSFPDNYIFFGSRAMKNLQVGNAVPPLLSIALTKEIKKLMIL